MRAPWRLLLVVWLGSGVSYAQSSISIDQPAFHVGDTWDIRMYDVNSGNVTRTRIEAVTAVTNDGINTRETDNGKETTESVIKFGDRTGLYNFPLFVGKKWGGPIVKEGKTIGAISYVVRASEEISTAAGKFQALRIENEFSRPEGTFRQIIWYAPAMRHFARLFYVDKQSKPERAVEVTRFDLK
jgi:hypothetical protein